MIHWIKNIFRKEKSVATKKKIKKGPIAKTVTKEKKNPLMSFMGSLLLLLFCGTILALSIRGIAGNPTPKDLNRLIWKDNGPLELSPERGRYALTYALAETGQFTFSPDLARFAAPDVAYKDGKYVSLFAPAVSFIVAPGYLLGKMIGMAQVGTFAVIALFALINLFLIRAIAIRLGAHPLAAAVGGISFVFASPAFAYAVTLYQHHISTFLILAGVYLLMRFNSIWSLMGIWILCALSISVDYPNLFMMLPIGFAALGKLFFTEKVDGKLVVRVPLLRILSIAAMALPLAFFLWFNNASYGNPFQLSGTIERSVQVNNDGSPVLESVQYLEKLKKSGQPIPTDPPEKNALAFFESRLMLNGMYEHFVSADRGMLMYTPVMLFGIAGLIYAIKRRMRFIALFTAVIGFNVLLYSMWSDPYGGWAFGSRYLIPTYAMLSVFIAVLLTKYANKMLFLLFFLIFFGYSVGVNTLGALTSNRNPPKVEAVALSEITKQKEEYTYMRNVNLLNSNLSKAYVYETYAANTIPAWNYYIYLTSLIFVVAGTMIVSLRVAAKGVRYEV